MTEILSVDCEIKEIHGKGVARSLRRESKVPINIYGKDLKNISASIAAKAALEVCNRFAAKTSLVEIKVGKDTYEVLPKEISLHPVTDEIIHIDFLCIKNAKTLKVDVPIKISGAELSLGIKRGGVVNITTRFLTSKVKKGHIPSFIEVDISKMVIGDTLRLQDLNIPQHVTLVDDDPKKTIIKLVGKKSKDTGDNEGAEAASGKAEGNAK